jgi:hypothetical protein
MTKNIKTVTQSNLLKSYTIRGRRASGLVLSLNEGITLSASSPSIQVNREYTLLLLLQTSNSIGLGIGIFFVTSFSNIWLST